VRRQSTDKRDAGHILTLLLEKRVSPVVEAERGDAGSAAVCYATGTSVGQRSAHQGEEQLAAPGDDTGGCQKEEPAVVDRARAMELFQQLAMPRLGGGAAEDLLHLLKQLNRQIEQFGSGGEAGRRTTSPGPVVDDPAWSGASDGPGFSALTIGMWHALPVVSSSPAIWAWFPANTARQQAPFGAITKQGNCFLRSCWWKRHRPQYARDEGFRKEYHNTVAIIVREGSA